MYNISIIGLAFTFNYEWTECACFSVPRNIKMFMER